MTIKRIIVVAVLATATVFAPTGSRAGSANESAATAFVDRLMERTMRLLQANQTMAKPERDRELCLLLLEGLDFDHLATASLPRKLARQARQGSAERVKEFTKFFAAYVIDVAIKQFGEISLTGARITRVRAMPNDDVMVFTQIDRQAGGPLNAGWRVRNTNGAPKIVDVEIEGYSLRMHYRGFFERGTSNSVLSGTIEMLRKRVQGTATLAIVAERMN